MVEWAAPPQLNALLSLLHPFDRCRTLSAVGSAIGRPYRALSTQSCRSSHPACSKHHLGSFQPRGCGARVSKNFKYHWSKNHYTHNFYCWRINIAITHTHISYTALIVDLCNACASLVSACLASMISQKDNYTTKMLRELISNYPHTSYTSIIVGELIV